MIYINHLSLRSGHLSRIAVKDVSRETIARVSPWLLALVAQREPLPLPVSGLADFAANASVFDGALLLTVSGPPSLAHGGKAPPLASIGVAKRSRHGAALWPLLTSDVMPAIKPGLRKPTEPWCAVVLWPTLALHPSASRWLGDFERCVAWAWVTADKSADH